MLYVRDWARVWGLFGPAILLLVCIKRLCSSIRSLVSHIIVYPGYPNNPQVIPQLQNNRDYSDMQVNHRLYCVAVVPNSLEHSVYTCSVVLS